MSSKTLLGPKGLQQRLGRSPDPQEGTRGQDDKGTSPLASLPGAAPAELNSPPPVAAPQPGAGDQATSSQGDMETRGLGDKSPTGQPAAEDIPPGAADSSAADREATSSLVDNGTKRQGDLETSPLVAKRTDFEKKGHYIGLRHQDTLDDLAKVLRRYGLPDDRSMIVRALIDAASRRLKEGGSAWIDELAADCRQTLPGTTKNGGTRG